jgi:zinc protease
MVNERSALAIILLLAACSEAESLPVIRFDRDQPVCSEPEACIEGDTEMRELRGVRVILKRTPGDPLVAVRVFMDAGMPRTTARLAHAEWLLLQLTDWWGSDEFLRNWRRELANIGANVVAGAGADYSHVSLIVPNVNLSRGFQLLAAAVETPPVGQLSDSQFASIKAGYAQRYLEADDVEDAAANAAWSLFAADHPYNVRQERRDAIATVALADLKEVHQLLRHGLPMTVVMVGDLSMASAVSRVSTAFEDFSGATTPQTLPEFSPRAGSRLKFVVRPDSPAWHLYAYFRAPVPADDDYAALELGLRVLSARLFDDLRSKRGLVYAVTAQVSNLRVNYGYVTLSTADLLQATAALRDTLNRLVSDGIEESELDAQRAQYLTRYYEQSHSVESLSWMLGDWQLTSGDWQLAGEHIARIEAVDASAARDAVARYVVDLCYGVAGPSGDFPEAQITGAL